MNRANMKFWAVLACVLVLAVSGNAQAGRGKARLSGTVTNEQGQPVADADIQIEFDKGGLTDKTKTNSKGEFFFIGLGTGTVRVTATADSYLPASTILRVEQLRDGARNFTSLVMKEDKEGKMRLKDAAALEELEQGNQLFNERKFDEALAVYQDFFANNPNVYQILFNIGDVFREKGEFDKANEYYLQAQAKAREKADVVLQAKALASLGEVCLRQEKFKEAGDYFTQSIALNPKDEILAYNVGRVSSSAATKADKAIEYYKLATQIKPRVERTLRENGLRLPEQGRHEGGHRRLPGFSQAQYRRGQGPDRAGPDRLAFGGQITQ